MFFIPGFLISLVTFPGVIVHEFAHQFFCRLFRVPVFEVCYFRLGNPAGYVIHEVPNERWKQVMIGIGPFFVNSLSGFLIAFPSAIALKFTSGTLTDYLLIYLGVSIAMHSFPSTGDAKSIWNSFTKEGTKLYQKVLVAPIIGLIYIGSIGSMIWLDAIYGAAIAVGLPDLLVSVFA